MLNKFWLYAPPYTVFEDTVSRDFPFFSNIVTNSPRYITKMCGPALYARTALDHGPALCSIPLNHGPALCRIARDQNGIALDQSAKVWSHAV
jgi:hypothetical protein